MISVPAMNPYDFGISTHNKAAKPQYEWTRIYIIMKGRIQF